MKIKYWGTAASEGIPAVFCHCDVCKYARTHKGKEIRTRTQVIINDDLLIDFGPDTFCNSLKYDVNLADIEHCLITHSHEDHLYPSDIKARRRSRARLNIGTPPLNIYGGEGVKEELAPNENGAVTKDNSVLFHQLYEFQEIKIKDYSILPLTAQHKTKNPLVYAVQQKGKSYMYCHDTDIFDDRVWSFLEEKHIVFDAVSLDCTEGKKHIDYPGHMNFERNLEMREEMMKRGITNENTLFIASHFSHNGNITYKEACEFGDLYNFKIAYDGMEIEI